MNTSNENILISQQEINRQLEILGKQISEDYSGKKLYILSLLRGSFIFTADLVRKLSIPVKIGFMTTSSYGHDEISSGRVEIVQDVADSLEGFDVLIVDDIIDTGITMSFVKEHLEKFNPESIKCCALLNKPDRRKVDLNPDYCGFTIADIFVVGYGLNYGDYYRNKPYIFNWQS